MTIKLPLFLHNAFHDMKRQFVVYIVLGGLLSLTSGCEIFGHKANRTGDLRWWGELGTNRIVRLQWTMLVEHGRAALGFFPANSNRRVSVEKYMSDPSRWPDIQLLPEGTLFRCKELKTDVIVGSTRYILFAEVLNGELKGETVDIGKFFKGSPRVRGALQLYKSYLTIAEDQSLRSP